MISRRALLAAGTILAAPSLAFAQSMPAFTAGQVLTAAALKSGFGGKMDYPLASGQNFSTQLAIGTGGSLGRAFADWFNDTINVKTFGAFGDTTSDHPTVTTTLGSNVLTVGSQDFLPTDVGKHISVDGAGALSTTGSVTSIPVTFAGSAYTATPTVTLSNTGSGAFALPLAHMSLLSGTVAGAGAGCTTGTQTFNLDATVKGGRAVTFGQVSGVVASGVLSGTITVVTAGDYLSLPATVATVNLTGGGCTTAPTLNASFGVLKVQMAGAGSGYPAGVTAALSGGAATIGTPVVTFPVAPLSTTITGYTSATQVTLGAAAGTTQAAVTNNIIWGHDDTAAFTNAINYAATFVANVGAGHPLSQFRKVLYVPAGDYTITAALPQMAANTSLKGDGQNLTKIRTDAAFTGDLFWWDDAWLSSGYTPTLMTNMTGGVTIRDLTVAGNHNSLLPQNAFVFYDHDDQFNIGNVEVDSFPGRAFYMGVEKNDSSAYMRESHWTNVRLFYDGAPGAPVFDIASNSGGDTTNTNYLSGIDIYSPYWTGIDIHAPTSTGGPRGIVADYIRIEGNEAGGIGGDLLEIGDPAASVAVHGIDLRHLTLLDPYEGYAGVHVTSASQTFQAYGLYLDGGVSGTADAGRGIQIDFARDSVFHFPSVGTVDYGVTIGANAGAQLYINGDGNEDLFTYNVDPTEAAAIQSSVQSNGIPSNQAVDVQQYHAAANQVGSGQYSFTAGSQSATTGPQAISLGTSNQTAGVGDVAAGVSLITSGNNSVNLGSANQVSSAGSFVAGTGNSATGGGNETVSGHSNTSIGGSNGLLVGANATDRGRIGFFGMSAGATTANGDRQFGFQALSGVSTGTTPVRLTANNATAVVGNIVSLPNNSSYAFPPFIVTAFDQTNINMCTWSVTGLAVKRGASAATTALVGTPTITQTECDTTLTAATVAITADTTLGGLNFTFTGPTGVNTHVLTNPISLEVQ